MIQAGNEPDIAAADIDPMPALYCSSTTPCARCVHRILAGFIKKLDGDRFTLATPQTALWLRRFDTDDIAPYQTRLQHMSKLKPQNVLEKQPLFAQY